MFVHTLSTSRDETDFIKLLLLLSYVVDEVAAPRPIVSCVYYCICESRWLIWPSADCKRKEKFLRWFLCALGFAVWLYMALSLMIFKWTRVIPIRKSYWFKQLDITLGSVVDKLFEFIVLDRYSDFLVTSDLQFGFNTWRSTNSTTVLK